jgi:membrane protein YdbS with pleckstrin-like domain
MTVFLKIFGRLGSVVALVLLVVALLRQLIFMFGVFLALLKFAIVMAFVVVIVLIVFAILRDRSRRRREAQEI